PLVSSLPPSSPIFLSILPPPPASTPFPYTTLFRSRIVHRGRAQGAAAREPNPFRDLPLEEALRRVNAGESAAIRLKIPEQGVSRSEEHTSELQSRGHLVCRLLLEKKTYDNDGSTRN